MASFTDQIQTFNPYVSQLPVEAMVKVGMQKQQQYDQGVQKIQGYIDNIAGMDVANDADKAYLQSKLNDLSGKLKIVAAGDFSNQQLVNSVGGMATSIVKDPTVQNAVASTAWYRKQLGEMEKAISEGKSSVANVDDFNEQASVWLGGTKPGQKFNGRYSPYVDMNKKFLDVLKSLGANATQEDIAYATDPATGKPDPNKIAAVMARKGYEGISADRIENAINATLSPEDVNQLRIDANYRFKGQGVPELQKYAMTASSKQVEGINNYIEKLEEFAKAKSSSPIEASQALQSIEQLKAKKLAIEENLTTELENIAKNPSAAKFDIYKKGYVDSFSNAFSWEKQRVELMNNPALAAQHWEKENALAKSKFALDVRSQNWKEYIDTEGLKIDRAKLDLDLVKTYGTGSGFTTYAGTSPVVKDPVVAMRQDANAKDQQALDDVKAMATDLYKKADSKAVGNVEKSILAYQNAKTPAERNAAIPVEWREVADRIIENRVRAKSLNVAITNAEKKALEDPTVLGTQSNIYKDVQKRNGITLTIGGNPVTFTNKEVYDFLNKEKNVTQRVVSKGSKTGTVDKTVKDIDVADLTPKERQLFDFIKTSRYGAAPASSSASQSTVNNLFTQYDDLIARGGELKKSINKAVTSDLLERSGKYIPAINSIFVGTKDDMSRINMESIAGTILSRVKRDKGGNEGLNVGNAELMVSGDGKANTQYQTLVQGDDTFLVLKQGETEETIRLTPQEKAQLPKSKNAPSQQDIDVITAQRLNGGNTNTTGKPQDGFFQRNSFPNVTNLNVTADLNQNKSNSAVQYLNLNVQLPSGWKSLKLTNFPLDVTSATKRINQLTDKEVKELFLKSDGIPQAWKEEIKKL
jgi:hypothetical protein